MSDSVWPHRWQPTRLCCPWDSPGKNTGVGCHFFLQYMKVKSEIEVTQSCPTLSDPMDHSLPGSSVHGFSKQEYWSGLPFPPPADLPDPGMEPSAVAGRHPRSPRWITQGDHSHLLLTGASERSRETTRLKSKPGRPSSALLSLPCLFNLVVCLLAPFFLHSVNKNLLNAYYVPSVLLGSRSVCTNFHRAWEHNVMLWCLTIDRQSTVGIRAGALTFWTNTDC